MPFQHVLLQHHHEENGEVFQQLHERGFVGSSSGENLSSIHGDLLQKYTMVRTKGTTGPLRLGSST